MLGIGDNIHQRAVIRELMKNNEVWLQSFYSSINHDLIKEGLKLVPFGRNIARIKERAYVGRLRPPANSVFKKITYDRREILRTGSLMAAQFGSVDLEQPADADFRLPVPQTWRDRALSRINYNGDKPLLVYRPIVLNNVWHCSARSPDPLAYAELFKSIRDRFYVVSVADLKPGKEWIVGEEQDADLKLHRGELEFEGLAGLFAEAALVYSNPGFAPILAQAVGTPGIIIYGGNERYAATNEYGSKFAPTLAIEPDNPCGCYMRFHGCDKNITIAPAREKIMAFAEQTIARPETVAVPAERPLRTLVFGTAYVDTPERLKLTEHWVRLHGEINPDCDLLIVDSASPQGGLSIALTNQFNSISRAGQEPRFLFHSFQDNIGHLSRGGKDGWGRAFCYGLHYAIQAGYDYVAHIEGDSLFKLPVGPIVERMRREGRDVLSVPVEGTKRKEVAWVETGLMFFRTGYISESNFIDRYNWPIREKRPTPERVIFDMLGGSLAMMPWKAQRADKSDITVENVKGLDWVTHCHTSPEVYDSFVDSILVADVADVPVQEPVYRKINFGCGNNRIDGWENHDAEVDISKPLPFEDASVDYILAEHCVEHIDQYSAINFFRECRRILKPQGVLRVIVPSIEQIQKLGDLEYFRFTKRWGKTEDLRGSMHAILYAHGHLAAWTESLLKALLYAVGFDKTVAREPCQSEHGPLRDVDGHHRAIGEKFNEIESLIVEASA